MARIMNNDSALEFGSGPRVVFLLAETQVFELPVWAPIPPKKEEHFESVTGEELKRCKEKANLFGRNRKFEGALSKPRHKELRHQASQSCL